METEKSESTEPVGAQASAGSLISAAALLGAKGGRAGRGASKARTSKQAKDAANARWKRTTYCEKCAGIEPPNDQAQARQADH